MFTRFFLVALVAAGSGLQARSADLSKIERVIRKEPAYQGAPQYCLLVFGKEADTKIWMVRDGNTLYVDRKGNGDLTEPANKHTNPHGPYFTIDQIVERAGAVHKNLRVQCLANGTFTLMVGIEDHEREQYVGIGRMEKPSWGDKAVNAPIIHINGPKTLECYGPIYTLPRMQADSESRRFKLRLVLGTPGLGKGTFASYNEVCSENLGPIQADVEYPNPKASGEPIKQRLQLFHDG